MTHRLLDHWGKARRAADAVADGPPWHPLAYHCLDVAAAGRAWLTANPRVAASLAARLGDGWDADRLERFIVFALVLHDCGKLCPAFQNKQPHLAPFARTLRGADGSGKHVEDGLVLADRLAQEPDSPLRGINKPSLLSATLAPMLCHHGQPRAVPPAFNPRTSEWWPAAQALQRLASDVSGLSTPLTRPDRQGWVAVSWRLAGLAVLADWLGSGQDLFPYHPPTKDPIDYWRTVALPQAQRAVAAAGAQPPAANPRTGLDALTGQRWTPTPLQDWAASQPLPGAGPILAILEDMTGAGKTEAALVLAHRLIAAGQARGLYFALPTQASANMLYDRVQILYRNLFAPGSVPSLVLAHGGRVDHKGFRESIMAEPPAADLWEAGDGEDPEDTGEAADGDAASALCRAWLADSTRKALLADVGVGTIDQALLGVLTARYQALRLHGLADKVLIVDEVHALADGYVRTVLDRLVSAQAALGGATVILSATLEDRRRQALVDAFARGAGLEVSPQVTGEAFPCALILGSAAADRVCATPLAHRPALARSLAVRRLEDEEAAMARIAEAAADGAAVAWIRSTVDDAIAAYDAVSARGLDATLFHARFARCDRQRIEQSVVDRMGKSGPEAGRAHIVIATQVIEQSLDLDFDVLMSDLAPIDLLLQRAGRLWRHPERSHRPVSHPCLEVVCPDPVAKPPEDWLLASQPRSQAVYRDPALLWASARELLAADAWRIPEDQRGLITRVAACLATPETVPVALRAAHDAAEGENKAGVSVACANVIDVAACDYAGAGEGWRQDQQAMTRLSPDPHSLWRLAVADGNRLRPWATAAAGSSDAADWRRSDVSVSIRRLTTVDTPSAVSQAADALEALWKRQGTSARVLALQSSGDRGPWIAHGEDGVGRSITIIYTADRGLELKPRPP